MPPPGSKKGRSVRQENRIAKLYGGVRQPGSGNGGHRKGDVRTSRFLFEAKGRQRKDAKQITIKLGDLLENEVHALISDLLPVLTFELGGRDWYIYSDMGNAELIAE